MGIEWISSNINSSLPDNALFVGQDTDGDSIYVGRASYEGDTLPAKIVPSKNAVYISYNGVENEVTTFDVLCGDGFKWVKSRNGKVPANAITTGKTSDGEQLYIGRGHFFASLTPGKIQPSHHCLYIPYGSVEKSLKTYEALVLQDN